MGVYSFNEKEARIRVGWEIDKIDRASSVRGGQIRLIEDDRDGYTWRGSFREGKKFLRSIGLPRETKVGRVRSKS